VGALPPHLTPLPCTPLPPTSDTLTRACCPRVCRGVQALVYDVDGTFTGRPAPTSVISDYASLAFPAPFCFPMNQWGAYICPRITMRNTVILNKTVGLGVGTWIGWVSVCICPRTHVHAYTRMRRAPHPPPAPPLTVCVVSHFGGLRAVFVGSPTLPPRRRWGPFASPALTHGSPSCATAPMASWGMTPHRPPPPLPHTHARMHRKMILWCGGPSRFLCVARPCFCYLPALSLHCRSCCAVSFVPFPPAAHSHPQALHGPVPRHCALPDTVPVPGGQHV
jgi:hypothetical protein